MSGAVRSRTQSLLQTMSEASRSSLEMIQNTVRSRANSSMARLEEDSPNYSSAGTHSRSGSTSDGVLSSGGENNTFGHPIPRRPQWQQREERVSEEDEVPPTPSNPLASGTVPEVREPSSSDHSRPPSPHGLREARSNLSSNAPSLQPSESTMRALEEERSGGLAIPGSEQNTDVLSSGSSHADISTAAGSFVTAAPTLETTTDDSGRTVSSWGGISHMVDRSDSTWRPA